MSSLEIEEGTIKGKQDFDGYCIFSEKGIIATGEFYPSNPIKEYSATTMM